MSNNDGDSRSDSEEEETQDSIILTNELKEIIDQHNLHIQNQIKALINRLSVENPDSFCLPRICIYTS